MTRYCKIYLALALMLAAAACRRGGERDYSALLSSGDRYLAQKDYVRATLEYRNAAKLQPDQAEPLYHLGLAYLAAGNIPEGVTALVKATEKDPKHAGAQVKLAELLANSQDPKLLEDARQRLMEVLSGASARSDALTVLAVTESRLGNLEAAEQHLREALQSSPADIKAAAILARVKLARRDPEGAEKVLRAAVEGSPNAIEPHLALADFLLLVNRRSDAEKELEAALKIDPSSARAALGLAALYYWSGRKQEAENLYRKVSASKDSHLRQIYGAFLFTEGRREEAIREFERLYRENPEDREARTRVVAAWLAAGRTKQAEQLLESVLKKNPRDVDALLIKSELLLREGRVSDAQQNLSEVLRFQPESAAAHLLLAHIYGLRGSRRLQIQQLSEALQHAPDQLNTRLALARLHMESGASRSALDVLNQAPPSQKRSLAFIVVRNNALLGAGLIDEYGQGVAEGLKIARIPDLLVQEAQWKLLRKDLNGARTSLEEALKLSPEHLGALDVWLRLHAAENRLSEGLRRIEQQAAARPGSARLQLYAGQRMQAAGRLEQARKFFLAAKKADPKMAEADLALAQIEYQQGRHQESEKILAALDESFRQQPAVQMLLAALATRAGNYQAARKHYEAVLLSNPDQVAALNNLAHLAAAYENRPDEALKYAQRARELAPGDPDVSGTLGWLYYRKGLYSTALEYLKEAVQRDGSSGGTNAAVRRYYLGLAYLKTGDRSQGLEILRKSLAAHPELPEAALARAAMEEITARSAP